MFKVYLKLYKPGGKFIVDTQTRTITPDQEAATVAFAKLLNSPDLQNTKHHLTLTGRGQTILYHRFDAKPGEKDFVRIQDLFE